MAETVTVVLAHAWLDSGFHFDLAALPIILAVAGVLLWRRA